MLRLVIFDFDGVIVDTEPAHFETMRQILLPEGIRVTWQQYCDNYMVYDDRECFTHVLRDRGREVSEELILHLVARKKAIFAQFLAKNVVFFPGLDELLNQLAQKGIICALCSGSFRSEIEFCLRQAQLRDFFEVIVAADDVEASKPNPQGYKMCLSRINNGRKEGMQVLPKQCVAIEDSIGGIKAAQAAGLSCLAVTNSYSRQQLKQADKIVDSLTAVTVEMLQQIVEKE